MNGKAILGVRMLTALAGCLLLSSCGGGGTEVAPGEVLFDGAPGELAPHMAGQVARFHLMAETGDESRTATITATVLSDEPTGEFVAEQASDPADGARVRTRLRESASEIRVEAYALEDEAGSFDWTDLERPAVVVRTPVVAGEAIEAGFFRLLDLSVTVNGETRTVRAPLQGRGQRTATGWVDVALRDGRAVSAIRFEIRADASLRIPVSGVELALRIVAEELYAPGIGLVAEELEIEASAGGETGRARWIALREP